MSLCLFIYTFFYPVVIFIIVFYRNFIFFFYYYSRYFRACFYFSSYYYYLILSEILMRLAFCFSFCIGFSTVSYYFLLKLGSFTSTFKFELIEALICKLLSSFSSATTSTFLMNLWFTSSLWFFIRGYYETCFQFGLSSVSKTTKNLKKS